MSATRLFFQSDVVAFEERLVSCTIRSERAAYLVAFLREGASTFVSNANGIRTAVLVVGDCVIPLVINDGASRDCYLVSPFVHYIAYLVEEAKKMRPAWASLIVRALLRLFGYVFGPLRFDRFVSINNWLFTTSLTQSLSAREIGAMKDLLRVGFPDHALVYRGLELTNEPLVTALAEHGFQQLMHRPVLEWFPDEKHSAHSRYRVNKDIRLTGDGPYGFIARERLDDTEIKRVVWMYRRLYIEKHSRYNVEYTERFFEVALGTNVNTIELVTQDGAVCAFVTLCRDGSRIISALVGYDPIVGSKRYSPYSAAVGCGFRRAKEENRALFLSTGVSLYKRMRGARETMEYEAFDVGHLPWWRRIPWQTMKQFLDLSARFVNTSDI